MPKHPLATVGMALPLCELRLPATTARGACVVSLSLLHFWRALMTFSNCAHLLSAVAELTEPPAVEAGSPVATSIFKSSKGPTPLPGALPPTTQVQGTVGSAKLRAPSVASLAWLGIGTRVLFLPLLVLIAS